MIRDSLNLKSGFIAFHKVFRLFYFLFSNREAYLTKLIGEQNSAIFWPAQGIKLLLYIFSNSIKLFYPTLPGNCLKSTKGNFLLFCELIEREYFAIL